MREPLAGAGQAESFLVAGAQSTAVILDIAAEHVALAPHRDGDRTLPEVAEAVAEGVFDERLQEEVRHARVARLRFDVDRDAKPVAEPQAHDLDVALEEIELGLERHFLRADVLQRHPQEIAQRGDHRIGAANVLVHERRDRVKRVEQKVRLKLHAQHVKLRLRETGLEL